MNIMTVEVQNQKVRALQAKKMVIMNKIKKILIVRQMGFRKLIVKKIQISMRVINFNRNKFKKD